MLNFPFYRTYITVRGLRADRKMIADVIDPRPRAMGGPDPGIFAFLRDHPTSPYQSRP